MPRTVAIIGASATRSKFGNKSVRAHLQAGWTVYAVNPTAAEIEGVPVYPDLDAVPAPLDRVSLYVPPAVGAQLLDALVAKNAAEVYFNPGSDDPDLVERARAMGIAVVVGCSIVDVGFSPAQFPDG